MIEEWIKRYFPEEKIPEVLAALGEYGGEPWHRERQRVWRDAVIVSRGNMTALRETVELAKIDYRDILVGEEVDPWLIGELKRY